MDTTQKPAQPATSTHSPEEGWVDFSRVRHPLNPRKWLVTQKRDGCTRTVIR